MAPRPGSRTYGATDDPSKLTLLRHGSQGFAQDIFGGDTRGSISVQASALPVTDTTSTKRRWLAAAVISGLAIAAVSAVIHAGSTLPENPAQLPRESMEVENAGSFAAPTSRMSNGHLLPRQARPEHQPLASTPRVQGATAEDQLEPLTFTALNFYHIRDGKPGENYPWLQNVKLIEPYRETTLTVTNPLDGFGYRWSARGGDDSSQFILDASGVEITALFTALDENIITLEEVDSHGVVTRRLEETVMVKYVRREIRTLTDEETGELLDAVRGISTKILLELTTSPPNLERVSKIK